MSSFKKRASAKGAPPPPPGTRVSAYNSSVLLSTGIASVDDILGGGCPLGSILLLEEDKDTSYAKLLVKYWVGQGLCCPNQRVVLVSSSLDQSPQEILDKLPYSDDAATGSAAAQATEGQGVKTHDGNLTDDEDDGMAEGAKENMKIAFRYEGLKKFETSVKASSTVASSSESPYCSTFDLTKTLDLTEAHHSRLSMLDVEATGGRDAYGRALAHVRKQLEQSAASGQAVKIALQSVASPGWGDFDVTTVNRFLLSLKLLLREHAHSAAALVTLPGHMIRSLTGGPAHLRRLEWNCDSVIELESFAGSPSLNAVFPAYSGFLHIHRLPTPNSLLPPSAKLSVLRGLAPGANSTSSGAGGMDNNLGFKLKRRRGLIVETLHLDEGGGTGERRTTPAVRASEQPAAPESTHSHSKGMPTAESTSSQPPVKKKMERRKIRFDDDPSENPSGILGSNKLSGAPKSGLQRDKPELYEF